MNSIRRVLVVQPYGIGDLLFVTPVLRALRLIPTVEKVDLLLGSRTEAVVRHNPHVDEIFSIDKDLFHRRSGFQNLTEMISLGGRLRKERYDLLLDYSLRGEYAFFSQWFLRIPHRAGFDYKRRGFFHNLRIPIPQGFKDHHVVDYVCGLAEAAGVPVEDRFLEFYLSSFDREEAKRFLEQKGVSPLSRFLIASPGGGESWGKDAHFKRWPVHFFAQLINQLARAGEFQHVLVLGSQGERELGDDLAGRLSMPCLNLAGEMNLPQAAALIEKAALFIGNDGGLVHLAHALCVPLVAFYGPVDPQVYGPYPASPQATAIFKKDLFCRPCYQRFRYNSACVGRECLQDLTPDEVWETLKSKDLLSLANERR